MLKNSKMMCYEIIAVTEFGTGNKLQYSMDGQIGACSSPYSCD